VPYMCLWKVRQDGADKEDGNRLVGLLREVGGIWSFNRCPLGRPKTLVRVGQDKRLLVISRVSLLCNFHVLVARSFVPLIALALP
jgi:hypothetical protein